MKSNLIKQIFMDCIRRDEKYFLWEFLTDISEYYKLNKSNSKNIYPDKRKTKWPFNSDIAEEICMAIAEGSRLSDICKLENFPSYAVVCRWRRENSDFNLYLIDAYSERKSSIEFEILKLRLKLYKKGALKRPIKKQINLLRKEAARGLGIRYPVSLKPKVDRRRQITILNTGVHEIKMRGSQLLEIKKVFNGDL